MKKRTREDGCITADEASRMVRGTDLSISPHDLRELAKNWIIDHKRFGVGAKRIRFNESTFKDDLRRAYEKEEEKARKSSPAEMLKRVG